MRIIFQGEEKRKHARMVKEARLIHQEMLNHLDEDEEAEADLDQMLLEELLREEEGEVLALLAAKEECRTQEIGMEDIIMSDIGIRESGGPVTL